ncbi:hypothetical protein CEQ51_02995 [Pseudomonas thivervalensis]|uniref:Uncharacterized protein n=1 Tax=Pseudomonas thivervalensis TaxID=86265 RepID=A0A2Z4ZP66_9PSED|nr:hypothetical protein CE140_03685 [Pseudomonas thivervalensis]AXA59081.1 hypothetical protein CEQ51_02995 [Pseudomonas thivervalensis]
MAVTHLPTAIASKLAPTRGSGNDTVPWRGSLLPLGRAAAPKKTMSAAHSSGSKLPRHKKPPKPSSMD